jgi:hypothetical protein
VNRGTTGCLRRFLRIVRSLTRTRHRDRNQRRTGLAQFAPFECTPRREYLGRVHAVSPHHFWNARARLQRQLHDLTLLRYQSPPAEHDALSSLPQHQPLADLQPIDASITRGKLRTLTLHCHILPFMI